MRLVLSGSFAVLAWMWNYPLWALFFLGLVVVDIWAHKWVRDYVAAKGE